MNIKIGTRGSKLALYQANYVKNKLEKEYPEIHCELVIISTKGDKLQNVSFQKLKSKTIFIDEIEHQLKNKQIDMAVHSMKDLPAKLSEDFVLTNCLNRTFVEDVLVLKPGKSISQNLRIGTGSIRRKVQLEHLFPKMEVVDIRGNVDTRLRKIDEGLVDGIVIAKAGLVRLGLQERISYTFPVEELIPACMQGAIAIELRKEDEELIHKINCICDLEVEECLQIEKEFMIRMNGNCTVPLGAICTKQDEMYTFTSFYENRENTFHKKGKDPKVLLEEAIQKCVGGQYE